MFYGFGYMIYMFFVFTVAMLVMIPTMFLQHACPPQALLYHLLYFFVARFCHRRFENTCPDPCMRCLHEVACLAGGG